MEQEARRPAGSPDREIPVRVPEFMKEILAALTAELRRSPQINHHSGVSVRYSIGNLETLVAAAMRRAARTGEAEAVPRIVDLPAVLAGSLGRVEFDAIEEGREEEILLRAERSALLEVFRRRLSGFDFAHVLGRFDGEGFGADTSDLMTAQAFLQQFGEMPGLGRLLGRLGIEEESPGVAASALEFALEGLHLSRRLNKDATGRLGAYRYEAAQPRDR
jgi:magnesium chelatase subunit I